MNKMITRYYVKTNFFTIDKVLRNEPQITFIEFFSKIAYIPIDVDIFYL